MKCYFDLRNSSRIWTKGVWDQPTRPLLNFECNMYQLPNLPDFATFTIYDSLMEIIIISQNSIFMQVVLSNSADDVKR